MEARLSSSSTSRVAARGITPCLSGTCSVGPQYRSRITKAQLRGDRDPSQPTCRPHTHTERRRGTGQAF
eukprot:jgi/Botrbrau1/11698/Bobra.0195s0029.1